MSSVRSVVANDYMALIPSVWVSRLLT